VAILDQQGRLRLHLNEARGLKDNAVRGLWPEPNGALWY
jgi:hypothetical protein